MKSDWLPQAVTDGSSLLRFCGKRTVSDHSNCRTSNYPDFLLFTFRALKVLPPHNYNKIRLQLMNIYLNCIIANCTLLHVSTKESHFQGDLYKMISSFGCVGKHSAEYSVLFCAERIRVSNTRTQSLSGSKTFHKEAFE